MVSSCAHRLLSWCLSSVFTVQHSTEVQLRVMTGSSSEQFYRENDRTQSLSPESGEKAHCQGLLQPGGSLWKVGSRSIGEGGHRMGQDLVNVE